MATINENERLRTVELVPYDANWPEMFSEEAKKISHILQKNLSAIHHIGSTAIPGIYAKPVVDILPVVKDLSLVDALNPQFEALGYVCLGEYGIAGRRFYWKSPEKRTHHIHLFAEGSPEINRHVAFRNFMREHKNYAKAYSIVKRCLAEVFFHDIENYVNGKASFVQAIDYKTGNATPAQLNAEDNIVITPYNPAWPKLAEAEIKTIKHIFLDLPFEAIEHIGSTAVPELSSKPIIDIFITVKKLEDAERLIAPLASMGYIFWDENPDHSHLRFFKGMPPFGKQRTHHVHIVESSNKTFTDRIAFRDILRTNEAVRLEYEELKKDLSQRYANDREAYTDAKTNFINQAISS